MYENSDLEELRLEVSNLNYRLNEVMNQLDRERQIRYWTDIVVAGFAAWIFSLL